MPGPMLRRPPSSPPKGRVATQTCPRKQFPMFAPLRSTLAAPDRLTLEQTNQTNPVSKLFSRVFLLETLQVEIAAPPYLTSLVYSFCIWLGLSCSLNCIDRLSRALGHTYTGRPHLFPVHLPYCPFRIQSFYTVLSENPKHASY